VPGATGRTFTPRPQDLGKKVTVAVSAQRPGYLTATVPSEATASVLPGVMRNTKAPVVSGRAVVGRTLSATHGAWSVKADTYGYQWYAGHGAIKGATGATYQPTADVAGRHLHVVVTAHSAGYTSLSAESASTGKVVLGRIAFAKPTIRGRGVVGRTLTAHVGSVQPSTAEAHYRWYRDHRAIRGARGATYVVQSEDLGHRVHVVVTLRAENWTSRTKRSAAVDDIRTQPRLHPRTSLHDGRVFLRLVVRDAGLAAPDGRATVLLGSHRVGRFDVTGGRGSRLLAAMRHGRHTLTIVYRGGAQEAVGRTTVDVTVP
jgi:hypothetical protein